MIEALKPYAEYKESGQKWLGRVPRHWSMRRLRASITDCANGLWGSDPNGRDDLVCVRVADFDRLSHRVNLTNKTLRSIPTSARSRRLLRNGDLLLEKSGGGDLQPVGAVVSYDYDEPAVCSNFVARMSVANGFNGRFVAFLHSVLYAYRINMRSVKQTTGIQNLDSKAYLLEIVAFPPLDEQVSIVRFLDHANSKINHFIRAKRMLIRLLNEQKQAIIHQAVTRGLHSDVSLKPSGVLWVDGVPQHWSMTPNRSLFRIRKVLVGSRYKDYQVLSLTKRGVIVRDMDAGGKFSNHWERSQEVRPHDLVFCFFDVDETPRAVGLSRALGMISPDYTVMECPDPLVASFLERFYVAMDDRKMLRPLYTGLRKRISKPLFLAAKTPIPPPEEMQAILAFINDAVVEIDKSLDGVRREIELMQEYLTRLTADIVTGKLDVHEAAAKLPDLPAATEPMVDGALDEEIETEEVV